ncbi:hypothetical protein QCA50_017231 [Cerrena zonata]|uniref:Uncharacterized protein n=1 Tax=Cerrena zonata TaxID=2478898 RepID=A0AAW0FHI6_9APHY
MSRTVKAGQNMLQAGTGASVSDMAATQTVNPALPRSIPSKVLPEDCSQLNYLVSLSNYFGKDASQDATKDAQPKKKRKRSKVDKSVSHGNTPAQQTKKGQRSNPIRSDPVRSVQQTNQPIQPTQLPQATHPQPQPQNQQSSYQENKASVTPYSQTFLLDQNAQINYLAFQISHLAAQLNSLAGQINQVAQTLNQPYYVNSRMVYPNRPNELDQANQQPDQ